MYWPMFQFEPEDELLVYTAQPTSKDSVEPLYNRILARVSNVSHNKCEWMEAKTKH